MINLLILAANIGIFAETHKKIATFSHSNPSFFLFFPTKEQGFPPILRPTKGKGSYGKRHTYNSREFDGAVIQVSFRHLFNIPYYFFKCTYARTIATGEIC